MSPKPENKKTVKKKRKSKKVAELEVELQAERERSEKYLNQLKYARADLENLRKQMQKRIDEEVDRGNQRIIMRFLPIVEELDLAIEAARKMGNDGLLEGVEMVRRKLEKVLDSEGVSPIEALGWAFDPRLHEAVLEVETDEHPDGKVVEEIRKGYLYKGRVLRASMVKVARNKSSEASQEAKEDE